MEISKEDKILLAGIEDKLNQCISQYRVTYTGFLDIRQRSLAESMLKQFKNIDKSVRWMFYGGYDEAERTVALFLPDYAGLEDCPISIIRIKTVQGGRKLTHRDYLGSITGLGIKREMTGDIITYDGGADIIILDEIKDFILLNYSKAGRTSLTPEAIDISKLKLPENRTAIIKDTVASLRLDNVVASSFKLSRAKAAEAIRSGIVFVNSIQTEKPDMQIEEGTKIVMRGKGKVYLKSVEGRTKKDRIFIVIEKYI